MHGKQKIFERGDSLMKQTGTYISIFILCVFFLVTHVYADSSSPVTNTLEAEKKDLAETPAQPGQEGVTPAEPQKKEAENNFNEEEGKVLTIADPIYPWNKAMYHFNDKFYFWILKPVAKGYSSVMPEDIRIVTRNFFSNIATPLRIVGSLLQLKVKDAGNELIRFVYNSTAGVLGLADAAKADFNITRHEEDIGQALGSYGIGHGFYIVWPFIGPSSLRDTIGLAGDYFLDPVSYVNPLEASLGIRTYDRVNETSLRIGDYEDLKKAAIDPYISIRDAYIQNRQKKVDE
jgi:phospholipid-binding lipoprotein MlaA